VITRTKKGRGFAYFQGSKQISDEQKINWIKSLAIPPAWNEVKISPNSKTKVLAEGRDAAGRLQKIYNPSFRQRQERKKYSRVIDFAYRLPRLRRRVAKDLDQPGLSKDKVLACIVKLIDEVYFRVGNEQYAKQNESYGITTLRRKHIDISGYTVTFSFTGKSGQHQERQITDKRLAKILKHLDEMPGYEIFRYEDENGKMHNVSSTDVNDYIRQHMGAEFTAKDFRTWGGTLLAINLLAAEEQLKTDNDRKRAVTTCVKNVAKKLGNTPAVARSSYIDPEVFVRYMGGADFKRVRAAISTHPMRFMTMDEHCALNILESMS
jgi:DNA topoisomerase-1